MSDELTKILKEFYKQSRVADYIESGGKLYQKDYEEWLEGKISPVVVQVKKWALRLLGKEKKQIGFEGHNLDELSEYSHEGCEIIGYNEAKAEFRKKIEEEKC